MEELQSFIEKYATPSLLYIPLPREIRIQKRRKLTRKCDVPSRFKDFIRMTLCMSPEFFLTYEKDSQKVYKLIALHQENKHFCLRFYLIPSLIENEELFEYFCRFMAFIKKVQTADSKNPASLVVDQTFFHKAVSGIKCPPWCTTISILETFPILSIEEWSKLETLDLSPLMKLFKFDLLE